MTEVETSAIDEGEPTRLQPRTSVPVDALPLTARGTAAPLPALADDDDESTAERPAPHAATVVDDSGLADSVRAELDGPTPKNGWPADAPLPTLADGGFDVPPTLVDGSVPSRMRIAIADAITNTHPLSLSGVLRPQPLQSVAGPAPIGGAATQVERVGARALAATVPEHALEVRPRVSAAAATMASSTEPSCDYTMRPPIDITRAPTRRHRHPPAAVTDDAPVVVSERVLGDDPRDDDLDLDLHGARDDRRPNRSHERDPDHARSGHERASYRVPSAITPVGGGPGEAPTAHGDGQRAMALPRLPTLETRSLAEDPVMPAEAPIPPFVTPPLAREAATVAHDAPIPPAVTPLLAQARPTDARRSEPPPAPGVVPSTELSSAAALPPIATRVAWPLTTPDDDAVATPPLVAPPAPGAPSRRLGVVLLTIAALVVGLATWLAR